MEHNRVPSTLSEDPQVINIEQIPNEQLEEYKDCHADLNDFFKDLATFEQNLLVNSLVQRR